MCAAQSAAAEKHSVSSVFQVAAQVVLVAKSLTIPLHHWLCRILLLQKPYSTFQQLQVFNCSPRSAEPEGALGSWLWLIKAPSLTK